MKLYRRIDLPSDEPVQFVGVYTTRWGSTDEATVAFVEADDDVEQFVVENTRLRAALLAAPEPHPNSLVTAADYRHWYHSERQAVLGEGE